MGLDCSNAVCQHPGPPEHWPKVAKGMMRMEMMTIKSTSGNTNTSLIDGIEKAQQGIGYVFNFHPDGAIKARATIYALYARLAYAYAAHTASLDNVFTPEAVEQGFCSDDLEPGGQWSTLSQWSGNWWPTQIRPWHGFPQNQPWQRRKWAPGIPSRPIWYQWSNSQFHGHIINLILHHNRANSTIWLGCRRGFKERYLSPYYWKKSYYEFWDWPSLGMIAGQECMIADQSQTMQQML